MRPRSWMILGGLAAVATAVVMANPPLAPRASANDGALRHSVYVWQRAWDEAVREAVVERARGFAGVVALSTELAWNHGALERAEVPWDVDALRATGASVGLALRIGPCARDTMRKPETVAALVERSRDIVCAAQQRGLAPSELQIDFDCATSRLDDYATWVRAISAAVAPVPVTITVLPSWMRSDAFGALVRETDGFVLQVHSVDQARIEDDRPSLCDDRQARRWIEDAARFGVPFRVALPTYGYLAIFDEQGRLNGLVAESPVTPKRDATHARQVRADPEAMAMLVRELQASRPAALCGVIWYRLPVEGDRLNWSWPTLQCVMRGQVPEPALRVTPLRDGSGLIEVQARNEGSADAALPGEVRVRWQRPSRLVAADGLMGMQATRQEEGVIFRQADDATGGRLRPGESRRLGWLRLEGDMEVAIDAH